MDRQSTGLDKQWRGFESQLTSLKRRDHLSWCCCVALLCLMCLNSLIMHINSVNETRQSKATTPEDNFYFSQEKRWAVSGRTWTHNILHTRQTLYQLSHRGSYTIHYTHHMHALCTHNQLLRPALALWLMFTLAKYTHMHMYNQTKALIDKLSGTFWSTSWNKRYMYMYMFLSCWGC